MLNTTIYENSMFDTPSARATLVGDSKLCTELFFINFVGFLGLYALNDSRGYMKTQGTTEKKLKIGEIADDNHDASLVIKLAVDSGILPEAKTIQVTRLLSLIKQRTLRSKDIDSVRIRELIELTQMHIKPMTGMVKQPVSAFMDGQIDIKEFSRLIYDVAKNNAWRPYTLELRTLILKGQYTDYFTQMKRGVAVAPPANQSAALTPKPATAPKMGGIIAPGSVTPNNPVAGAAAKPVAPKAPAVPDAAQITKDIAAIINRNGNKGDTIVKEVGNYYEVTHKMVPAVKKAILEVIPKLPLNLFDDGWVASDFQNDFASGLELRAIQALEKSKAWTKYSRSYHSLISANQPSGQARAEALEAKEVVLRAVKDFGVPDNSSLDNWVALSGLFRNTMPGAKDRYDALFSLVKPNDTVNHNIHLLTVIPPQGGASGFGGTGSAHLMETSALSPRALAWVRKYGSTVTGANSIVLTSNMTSATWAKLTVDAKWLWMANNFDAAGAKRVSVFRRNENNVLSPNSVSAATRAACAELVKDKWADANHLREMIMAGNDHNVFLQIAAQAAIVETLKARKPLAIPETLHSAFGTFHSDRVSPEMKELLVFLDGLPCETAGETHTFNEFAKGFFSTSYRRDIPSGFINLANDANHSHVNWLPWGRAGRNSNPDGVISWGDKGITLDTANISKSVAAWARTHGRSSTGVPVGLVEEVLSVDTVAEIIVKAASSNTMAGRIHSTSAQNLQDVRDYTVDQWRAVCKRVYDEGKTVGLFTKGNYNFDSLFSGHSLSLDGVGQLAEAMRQFVTNDLPNEVSKDMTSYRYLDSMRAPMTPEKMLVAAYEIQYSYRGEFNSSAAGAILLSAVDGAELTKETEPVYKKLLKNAAEHDPGLFAAAGEILMKGGKDEFRQIVLVAMMQSKLAPPMYDVYRWAWGLTAADIESILDARAAELETEAAAGRYEYHSTPLDIDTNSKRLIEIKGETWMSELKASAKATAYYMNVKLTSSPWLDDIAVDKIKPAPVNPRESMYRIMQSLAHLSSLDGVAKGGEIAVKLILPMIAAIAGGGVRDVTGERIDRLVGIAKTNGVDDKETAKLVDAVFKAYEARKAKPVDYAELAEALKDNSTEYVTPENMAVIVKRLASSTAKACEAAISALAYTSTSNGGVSKTFIDAVRLAGVERATINRLGKTSVVGQATARINADPNGSPIHLTPSRINDFLRYNDVDVSNIKAVVVTKLEELGKFTDALNTIIPPLQMSEDLAPEAKKRTVKFLHENNQYNHHPALGLDVKRVFKVDLPGQRDKFAAWVAANPTSKVMTLFHGTGTWAAQFLLRYGFRIIKPTDGSVTGRMLGDGIYFADNINKSMLYMSNAGYIRQEGQEGYVFKCKVALGRPPKDHREGNAQRSGLVSNEWAIFSLDQIIIEEAYLGVSRRKEEIKTLLNEADDGYVPTVSSFMFMDGMIPITAELMTDFEKMPEFGPHVTIETSAKGPIVNIRHDSTVVPVSRCYRFGEELHAEAKKPLLKEFLDLLNNRY